MRDGQGAKLSPDQQQKVKNIQGAPDEKSVNRVSISPDSEKDTGDADKPAGQPTPAPGLRGEE